MGAAKRNSWQGGTERLKSHHTHTHGLTAHPWAGENVVVQILGLAEDRENSPSELGFVLRAIKCCSLGSERFVGQVDLLSEWSLYGLKLFKYRASVSRCDQAAPASPENVFFCLSLSCRQM